MTNKLKKFTRKIRQRFDEKQNAMERIPAVMGDGNGGLLVSGQSDFIYCQIGDKVAAVYNNRVPSQIGLSVWIGRTPEEPNLFQVLSTRSATPAGVDGSYVNGYAPAKRYEWHAVGGGQDPLAVHLRAFTPLKLSVSDTPPETLEVYVNLYRGFIWNGTGYKAVARQDIDLYSYIPTTANKAAFVLITIDNSGTPIMTKGAEVDIDALVITDIPAIPLGTCFVCGAVRVYYGQTKVQEGRTNTDIFDTRFTSLAGNSINSPQKYYRAYDPTVNDDTLDGYVVADIWINTLNDTAFVLTDATATAAVWVLIGGGSGNLTFAVDGRLAVAVNVPNAIVITKDTQIESVYAYVKTTGSASSTIIDVNLNGTTIYTTQANRPTIAYNDANGWVTTTPDILTFTAGDIITVDIDQIATGASDLVVVLSVAGVNAGGGGGVIAQIVEYETGAVSTSAVRIPLDNTIPQNTEGTEWATLAITPTSADNYLDFDVNIQATNSSINWIIVALFQDTTADALAVAFSYISIVTSGTTIRLQHRMTAGTTSATTFKVRIGRDTAGTVTINGQSGGRLFGGTLISSIKITEVIA